MRAIVIVSHSKQFLFVHIGKTAGTNVAAALEPYAHDATQHLVPRLLDRVGVHANYLGPVAWRRFRLHATAATAKRHLPADVYDGLFKFAFVRNPWEWFYSQWRFMTRDPSHHRGDFVRNLGGFDQYVQWEAGRGDRTQRRFVTDRQGELIVDYLGRFESLRDDFAAICRHLKLDIALPGAREGNANDYAAAYDGPETRRLALSLFDDDLEMFRYELTGPTCDTVALNRHLGLRPLQTV